MESIGLKRGNEILDRHYSTKLSLRKAKIGKLIRQVEFQPFYTARIEEDTTLLQDSSFPKPNDSNSAISLFETFDNLENIDSKIEICHLVIKELRDFSIEEAIYFFCNSKYIIHALKLIYDNAYQNLLFNQLLLFLCKCLESDKCQKLASYLFEASVLRKVLSITNQFILLVNFNHIEFPVDFKILITFFGLSISSIFSKQQSKLHRDDFRDLTVLITYIYRSGKYQIEALQLGSLAINYSFSSHDDCSSDYLCCSELLLECIIHISSIDECYFDNNLNNDDQSDFIRLRIFLQFIENCSYSCISASRIITNNKDVVSKFFKFSSIIIAKGNTVVSKDILMLYLKCLNHFSSHNHCGRIILPEFFEFMNKTLREFKSISNNPSAIEESKPYINELFIILSNTLTEGEVVINQFFTDESHKIVFQLYDSLKGYASIRKEILYCIFNMSLVSSKPHFEKLEESSFLDIIFTSISHYKKISRAMVGIAVEALNHYIFNFAEYLPEFIGSLITNLLDLDANSILADLSNDSSFGLRVPLVALSIDENIEALKKQYLSQQSNLNKVEGISIVDLPLNTNIEPNSIYEIFEYRDYYACKEALENPTESLDYNNNFEFSNGESSLMSMLVNN